MTEDIFDTQPSTSNVPSPASASGLLLPPVPIREGPWLHAFLLLLIALVVPFPATADDTFPAERLVFFAEGGPVLLHIDLSIAGKKLADYRRSFVEKKFAQLDVDSSGALEDAEAANVPALGQIETTSPALQEKWKLLDKSPEDGRLSLTELATHYEAAMGKPFSLTRRVKEQFEEVDLFSKLDADSDGAVSTAELTEGLSALIKLDLDDDETISAAELAPLFDPSNRQIAINTTENSQEAYPFLLLAGEANLDSVSKKLIEEYDREPDGKKNGSLTENEIPATWETIRRFDADADKALSLAELKEALQAEKYPVEILIRLPSFGRAKVTQPGAKVTGLPSSRLSVNLGHQLVEFVAKKWSSDVSNSISFYKIDFLRKDADKNSYLDANEFSSMNIPGASFAACDLDNDGKVFVKEMESFLVERVALSRSRLVMKIENDRKSLFQVLDLNLDRRLSHREFVDGYREMLKHDGNRDGRLSPKEMESRYKVTIELARTSLFEMAAANRMANANATSPRLEQSTEGPEWFRRMDVNRDGDVSRREFLGPVSQFDELDANADGFLGASEAEAAGKK
jgi:Ca2+-binding EF-hand superfamily protein